MPLPHLTRAAAPLTREVSAVNEHGEQDTVSIPAERALTVYVDKRELVTLMTLGAHPELLVLGYLRNQRLVESVDEIQSITVDWEVGAAAVRTHAGIDRIEERTAHRVVTTGCGQGSVFGGLMEEIDSLELPGTAVTQAQLYAVVNAIRLQLGWRTLWRDLRAGELRLLIVAVTLAVAALTAVGFFADRLKGGLQRDARQLLGGDAVVSSDNPTPQAFVDQARALGLQTVTTWVSHHGPRARRPGRRQQAGGAQGGGAGLPAARHLQGGRAPGAPGAATRAIPRPARPGSMRRCWTPGPQDGRHAAAGRCAPVAHCRIIVTEPDRGAGFMNFAPRVMINTQADLAATGLVQPASRLTYRWPWRGRRPKPVPRRLWLGRAQVKKPACAGVRVESLDSGRPECARRWTAQRSS
jgi:hypothetical protein